MLRRPFPAHRRGDAGLAKIALVLGLVAAVGAGATGAAVLSRDSSPLALSDGPSPAPVPEPTVSLAGALPGATDTVEWKRPLTLVVTDGTLDEVAVTGPDGSPYKGRLLADRWVGASSLLPGASYSVRATVRDGEDETTEVTRTVTAAKAAKVLHAKIDNVGATVGVGQTAIVRFDEPVKGEAARRAVLSRLTVTTTPYVEGAWRWYNSFEVHYRGAKYWTKGTTVDVRADLTGLRVPGTDVWGTDSPVQGAFTVGSALISTADLKTHQMTVTQDGKVLKVLPFSGGSDKYPTKGGVHIVLLKEKVHTFNSATVGIPTNSPDGYYKKLPWSVRISNGGAFVHSQPGSIRSQGLRNVSHGCVNLSPANAEWYFNLAKKGDIVDVTNAVVKPTLWDAGMADWNYSWETWQQGNLAG